MAHIMSTDVSAIITLVTNKPRDPVKVLGGTLTKDTVPVPDHDRNGGRRLAQSLTPGHGHRWASQHACS